MRDVVIVSAARTPIGNFGGALSKISAVDLGVTAAKEAIKRAGITPEIIDEVVIGNVLQAGLGQNVSRQIAINTGIPEGVPAMTLNKVCGSGLRTVSLAAQMIMLGDADVVLAGGTESMSRAPYLMDQARWGHRMGHSNVVDAIIKDGLWDAFNDYHMGITAENIAEQWNISREEQDLFALESQRRSEHAQKSGKFETEITPVEVPQRKGAPLIVDTDEFPKHNMSIEKLQKLRPAFKSGGTVTAGNASGINDGAAMVVLMAKEVAENLNLPVMATIKGYASAGVTPSIMGHGPVPATKKALDKAGLTIENIDLVEANEAFAAQAISVAKDLELDLDKVNVNGGAIALGHPIGASGTRILVTLLHEMVRRESKYGLATLCIGGGQGTTVVVERNEK